MGCDDDEVYEACFRVEVLAEIRDGVLRLYTHHMRAEEAGSNKVLLHHDVL